MPWKTPNDPAEPHFGRKALRWFRARLADYLEGLATPVPVADLVDWYSVTPRDFVRWVAAARYNGPGFASGGWELNTAAVVASLPAACAAIEARRFRSLEDWLAADLRGEIVCAPVGGSGRLDRATRDGLGFAKQLRRIRTHKTCTECGDQWYIKAHDGSDLRAKRCQTCRSKSKAARRSAQ